MDKHTQQLMAEYTARVRNKTIADIYHALDGKIRPSEFAKASGISQNQLGNLIRHYYPKR